MCNVQLIFYINFKKLKMRLLNFLTKYTNIKENLNKLQKFKMSEDTQTIFDMVKNEKNPGDPNMTHYTYKCGLFLRKVDMEKPIAKYQRIGLFGIKLSGSTLFMAKDNKAVHVTLIQVL